MRRTSLALCCVIFAACGDDPPVETALGWRVIHDSLEGALLRVWGTSSTDVYAVGSDPNQDGSLALHFDGTKWTKLDTGSTGDLWWLHQVAEDDIRMVGEGGLILKYTPSTGAFERLTAPGQATLFGCWGRASNDVWYVGGLPADRGVVWRDDGETIAAISDVPTPTVAAVFKVHGFDDGSVWVVGELGLAALADASGNFTEHETNFEQTLFTVHGVASDRVFAVGGLVDPALLAWDGTRFVDETPSAAGPLNAVWAVDREHAFAAGFNGAIFERKNGSWFELESTVPERPTLKDLHSLFVDEKGGIWAVGGQIASDPPRDGVMVHYGEEIATGL